MSSKTIGNGLFSLIALILVSPVASLATSAPSASSSGEKENLKQCQAFYEEHGPYRISLESRNSGMKVDSINNENINTGQNFSKNADVRKGASATANMFNASMLGLSEVQDFSNPINQCIHYCDIVQQQEDGEQYTQEEVDYAWAASYECTNNLSALSAKFQIEGQSEAGFYGDLTNIADTVENGSSPFSSGFTGEKVNVASGDGYEGSINMDAESMTDLDRLQAQHPEVYDVAGEIFGVNKLSGACQATNCSYGEITRHIASDCGFGCKMKTKGRLNDVMKRDPVAYQRFYDFGMSEGLIDQKLAKHFKPKDPSRNVASTNRVGFGN